MNKKKIIISVIFAVSSFVFAVLVQRSQDKADWHDKFSVPPLVAAGEIVEFPYTDNIDDEDIIIKADKQTYIGADSSEVTFSITNTTKKTQRGPLLFYFYNQPQAQTGSVSNVRYWQDDWLPIDIVKGFARPDPEIFKSALSKRGEIPKEFKIESVSEFEVPAGETAYFRMTLDFPKGSSGEFWIEALGEKGGYGLLDPWFVSDPQNISEVPPTGDEYWVYVKPQDEITTPDMIAGRSQKGDVVDVISTKRGNGGYTQSREYIILKVKGLTQSQISKLLEPYITPQPPLNLRGGEGELNSPETLAYRKYRVDIDALKQKHQLYLTNGTVPVSIDAKDIEIIEKTTDEISLYDQKAIAYENGNQKLLAPWRSFTGKIKNFLILTAKAANVRYVDPDSAGGDGTTNALSGANAAYASLALWEDARDGVLSDVEEVIVDSNGASHTADTSVVINGSTTTSSNYFYIHTPTTSRHSGSYNTTKYRMEGTPSDYGQITVRDDHVVIDGLQFNVTPSGLKTGVWVDSMAAGNAITVTNNLFTKTGATAQAMGYRVYDADTVSVIKNNIFYGFDGGAYGDIAINLRYAGTSTLYNNTFGDNYIAVSRHGTGGGTLYAVNNLFADNGLDTENFVQANCDYNATDNASLGYTSNTHDETSQTFTFRSGTYLLASNDTGATNLGIGPGSDANVLTTDIEGQARSGATCDIGADEFMVVTYTHYVDPDSAGGDGTTNALSGANAAFASLQAAITARVAANPDLTATNSIEEIVCDSNGESHTADGTSVVINGWTTDSDNYIYIHTPANSRHGGKWDATKYRLIATPSNYAVIYSYEDFVRIDGLQFQPTGSGAYTHGVTFEPDSDTGVCHISNSLVYGASIGSGKSEFIGIQLYSNDAATLYAWNNVIWDFAGDATSMAIFNGFSSSASKLYAYNNTLVNNTIGFHGYDVSIVAINNIVVGSALNSYVHTVTYTGSNYNSTDSADTDDGGANSLQSQTFSFVDDSNANRQLRDYHLTVDDEGALDQGLGTTPKTLFTDDIDGDSRPATDADWDIGADEYVAEEEPEEPEVSGNPAVEARGGMNVRGGMKFR